MPLYRVKSDINSGEHKPGDIIRLSELAAASMPWAVELAVPQAESNSPSTPPTKVGVAQGESPEEAPGDSKPKKKGK